MLRAAYFAQELLTTFTDEIGGVSLDPSDVNGSFIVRIDGKEIYRKKKSERFPETKELKQLVRDLVNPEKHLGHSDKS